MGHTRNLLDATQETGPLAAKAATCFASHMQFCRSPIHLSLSHWTWMSLSSQKPRFPHKHLHSFWIHLEYLSISRCSSVFVHFGIFEQPSTLDLGPLIYSVRLDAMTPNANRSPICPFIRKVVRRWTTPPFRALRVLD